MNQFSLKLLESIIITTNNYAWQKKTLEKRIRVYLRLLFIF